MYVFSYITVCCIVQEPGKLKLVPDCVAFKASHSGQVRQFSIEDVKSFGWMRVAKGFELKIFLKDGNIVKFDGFKEQVTCLQQTSKQSFFIH